MKLFDALLVALAFAALTAHAADPAPVAKPVAKPEIVKPESVKPAATPPATAKADARSAAGPVKVNLGSQQNRMKECNKSATGKKGPERKAFMKSCLSTRKA